MQMHEVFLCTFFWEHVFFLHGRQTDRKHLKYVSSNLPICLGLVPHLVALSISPASRLPLFLTALALPKQESSCTDSVSPLNVTNSQAHARICRIGRGAEDSEVLFVPFSLDITSHRYLSLIIIASALGSTTSVLPFEQLFPVWALEIACFHLWSLLQTPNTAEFNLLSGPRDIMLMCAHASWVVLKKRHRKQSKGMPGLCPTSKFFSNISPLWAQHQDQEDHHRFCHGGLHGKTIAMMQNHWIAGIWNTTIARRVLWEFCGS